MKKILHVDDDSAWRGIVGRTLNEYGHQVTSYSKLDEAQDAYANESWDVVICDGRIHVPDDGLDWASEIFSLGQRVIIIASINKDPRIPYIDKGYFSNEALLALVEY